MTSYDVVFQHHHSQITELEGGASGKNIYEYSSEQQVINLIIGAGWFALVLSPPPRPPQLLVTCDTHGHIHTRK